LGNSRIKRGSSSELESCLGFIVIHEGKVIFRPQKRKIYNTVLRKPLGMDFDNDPPPKMSMDLFDFDEPLMTYSQQKEVTHGKTASKGQLKKVGLLNVFFLKKFLPIILIFFLFSIFWCSSALPCHLFWASLK
jgi:hypothetical protein